MCSSGTSRSHGCAIGSCPGSGRDCRNHIPENTFQLHIRPSGDSLRGHRKRGHSQILPVHHSSPTRTCQLRHTMSISSARFGHGHHLRSNRLEFCTWHDCPAFCASPRHEPRTLFWNDTNFQTALDYHKSAFGRGRSTLYRSLSRGARASPAGACYVSCSTRNNFSCLRKRMRSGDRPGLQNRRAAGNPVTGGFDPHSLPPF
jgi:hypothetical protein